jgi:hypothetical protein
MTEAVSPESEESASTLLERTLEAFPSEKVQVAALIDYLDDRGYGLLLLMLALPMCVPNVPGISTIFGVLMLPPALGMILGARRPWVPGFLGKQHIDRSALAGTVKAATPMVRNLERLFRPRFSFLTKAPFTVFLGIQVLVLALVLILPIPGGNWPPGMAVAILGLALIQRDGLLALASFIAAVAATAVSLWLFVWAVGSLPGAWEAFVTWLRGLAPGLL